MSRLVTYGLDNMSVGEFQGILPRGWNVEGTRSVSGGGGQSSVAVSADVASQSWLDLGALVSADHPRLGFWAGVIDLPWTARPPVGITIYPLSYLLNMRTPDRPEILEGNVYQLVAQMLERMNAQEEMYVRLGDVAGVDIQRPYVLDQRTFWVQINALVAACGKELYLRPAEESGRLMIYVDIHDRVGVDTGFLLHDGPNANVQLLNPSVDGALINRLIGIGSQDASGSRLQTDPQLNQVSIDRWRLRSAIRQYQAALEETALSNDVANDLEFYSWPTLKLPVKILDVDTTFDVVRPGNSYLLHIANDLYLPGGVQGYRGDAHLTALAYEEADNTVTGLLEVPYGAG